MKKLNNKGMSIIEVVVTFSLIMFLVVGLLVIVTNYRNKVAISLERLSLDTFKNNLTQDINNDILTNGLKEITDETSTTNSASPCYNLGLNRCIVLIFYDNTKKALGTSKVLSNPNTYSATQIKNSIENKYIYYDGLKYKLKEHLPENLPSGRNWFDLSAIKVVDDAILTESFVVLEDGTQVFIYTIDIDVSHIDFKDDFGIHIVASTDNINM